MSRYDESAAKLGRHLDDDTCRARLHARNARGEHDFAATDAEFDLITRHFSVPQVEEGLVIEVHRP